MSRSGIGALVVALGTIATVAIKRQAVRGRAVAIAFVVMLLVIITARVGADQIADRFATANWRELNDRRGPWSDAWTVIARFPIAGSGLNTYGVAMLFYQRHELTYFFAQAHNDYLQFLGSNTA